VAAAAVAALPQRHSVLADSMRATIVYFSRN
jgi:hypothetical protein